MAAGTITRKSTQAAPLIKLNFLSHGTLECKDIQATRRFYEEVLGFEVIQHLPIAMTLRLGSDHTYIVVQTGRVNDMNLMNHNGLDVGSKEDVDAAYEKLLSVKDTYSLMKIQKPHNQHGAYSFYFQDMDGNWWEILSNPPRGYARWFDEPQVDITER
jgi:catechol 2,3-dioxygenase-like lactoylglutathione lyase family enzyme